MCPDTAIHTNSIPTTSHNVSVALLSLVQSGLGTGRVCVKAEVRSNEARVCLPPTGTTARYSISKSSKQDCLSPVPGKAQPGERPLARDRRLRARVPTRRLVSHRCRQAKRTEKHRIETGDEKILSFHTSVLHGNDARFAGVRLPFICGHPAVLQQNLANDKYCRFISIKPIG